MWPEASGKYRTLAALCASGVLLLTLLIAGCQSTDTSVDLFTSVLNDANNNGNPAQAGRSGNTRRISSSSQDGNVFAGAEYDGTGQFISSRAPAIASGQRADGSNGYRLNLVNAPIAAAAKYILGDTLGLNYIISPDVQGTITLQSSEPARRDTLVDIFETALASNGYSIVRANEIYKIVPSSEVLAGTPSVSVSSVAPSGPGVKILVIELQYISAEEMRTILAPISRSGSVLRVDSDRNYLMLAGTNADLLAMREAISVFDVDWMRGMSVALRPLKTSKPEDVVKELDTIFHTDSGPGSKLIRFVANERLNSVLVITSRPRYLERAKVWIDKLDRLASSNEEQLFVYEIQNRPASELAKVLQSTLSGKGTAAAASAKDSSVAPDLNEQDVASQDAGSLSGPATSTLGTSGRVTVVADVENNALLISTTAREYKRIEQILHQLDILPTQVLLEAVIAEVTLNDELKFGVRWFFEKGGMSITLSDVVSGLTGAAFPGLAWNFASKGIEVTLNTLSSVTDVKVISAPTIMALNNQKAVLQIGDQVPIVTRQSSSVDNPGAPIVNSIELKDTGIILSVVPRVNSSGRVLLDIEQEASSVTKTTTSGIDSPTIQQRKIRTRVVVNDGEALVLGGLIQERKTNDRSQVPLLGEIPILGNVFKDKTNTIKRTELMIFIRPRVVRNFEEARSATDEFRRRLDFGKSETYQNRIRRDLKRLQ